MSQRTYDPLKYLDNGIARTMRDAVIMAKQNRETDRRYLRRAGIKVTRSLLNNQLQPYKSFGVVDGRSRTVYYLDVQDEPKWPEGTVQRHIDNEQSKFHSNPLQRS